MPLGPSESVSAILLVKGGEISGFKWNDTKWMREREKKDRNTLRKEPMAIYEVHIGSWHKKDDGTEDGFYTYREMAPMLAAYVKKSGGIKDLIKKLKPGHYIGFGIFLIACVAAFVKIINIPMWGGNKIKDVLSHCRNHDTYNNTCNQYQKPQP